MLFNNLHLQDDCKRILVITVAEEGFYTWVFLHLLYHQVHTFKTHFTRMLLTYFFLLQNLTITLNCQIQ